MPSASQPQQPLSTDIGQAIREATQLLQRAEVPSPLPDAQELAAHVLSMRRGQVAAMAAAGQRWDGEAAEQYAQLVAQRCHRIPLQHLTGIAHFRRLDIAVGPGVFIPRPETEVLVEHALAALREPTADKSAEGAVEPTDGGAAAGESTDIESAEGKPGADEKIIVELCAGSAAISLAVIDEFPEVQIIAVEKSPQALAWAARNINSHGASSQIRLLQGDIADIAAAVDSPTPSRESIELIEQTVPIKSRVPIEPSDLTKKPAAPSFSELTAVAGRVDVVVANPPYIPSQAVPREREVAEYDPPLALYGGGEDGLVIPRHVVAIAQALLHSGGTLLMEHGEEQGAATRALADTAAWCQVRTLRDLAGRDRILHAQLSG